MAIISQERVGQKHGRLTAITPTDERRDRKIVWKYQCDCGKEHFTTARDVVRGKVTSCGCYRRERTIETVTTHGATTGSKRLRSYSIWCSMKNRCKGNYVKAHRYSDRGITICERWLDYANFVADMGEPPPGFSLDRINNNGNYEPGNCRWADDVTQANNQGRRTETYILIDTDYLF